MTTVCPALGLITIWGALELLDRLNMTPVAQGELLVYSGDVAPVPIWSAEGAALVDGTTPSVSRVEAGPKYGQRGL